MLDHLFGLNARLGRLQYLLACIAMGIAMVAISLLRFRRQWMYHSAWNG
ncbi:MAG: hypothetical protein ABSG88_07910 [Bradyrhizobium sp.]